MSGTSQPTTDHERRPLLQPEDERADSSASSTIVSIQTHHEHTSSHTTGGGVEVGIGGGSEGLTRDGPKYDRLAHHREMVRERFSANWWIEWIIIFVVFSVTGSSTMLIVKPLMKALGLTGSLGSGPWSFCIAYIVLTLPLYSLMLLFISSLVCRRPYFENLLIRMWRRFIPTRLLRRCSTSRHERETAA
ncbi:hypothetical protein BG015_006569 [Linnemannia schmuckeri]|uniref:DUF6787 domain-containing protein n=1 Tax=Linnemannia schmuckeri TaxID=64567 RepID=A0A9P5S1X1_9FUNG|nr:hypothetical protein BG015_006569 [Linnemannia schmuckeri]